MTVNNYREIMCIYIFIEVRVNSYKNVTNIK
jgi:hypothetical protein